MPKAGPGLSLPARGSRRQRGGIHRLSKSGRVRSVHNGAFRKHSGGRAEHFLRGTQHSAAAREHCRPARRRPEGGRKPPRVHLNGSLGPAERSDPEAGDSLPIRNASPALGSARKAPANVSVRVANVCAAGGYARMPGEFRSQTNYPESAAFRKTFSGGLRSRPHVSRAVT